MRKNAFADALAADLDDDLSSEATLTMNGETPSLDASDAHSVGDSDDLSDEAETEASQAVTQANNKAASATKGKRKLSSRKASGSQPSLGKKFRREINHAALMKMNILDQANETVGERAKEDGPRKSTAGDASSAAPEDAGLKKLTATELAAAAPGAQKKMLGEVLHQRVIAVMPRVETDEVKEWVTGKLLESDNMVLLEMLDDRERLEDRIDYIMAYEYHSEETGHPVTPWNAAEGQVGPPNWAAECVAELATGRRRMAAACTAIGLTPPVQPPDTNIHRMYSAEYRRYIRQERRAANCQEGESSCGSVGNVDQKPYFPSSLPLDHPDCHWNRVAPWNGDDDDCHWNGVATEMVLLRGCTTPQW